MRRREEGGSAVVQSRFRKLNLGNVVIVVGLLSEVKSALEKVFAKPAYGVLALVSFAAVAVFSWLLPVYTIPGNDLAFWFEIAPWYSYAFLLVFSTAMALLIPMQVYVWRQRASLAQKGLGGAGLFSGVVSSVYSSAACAGCVTAFGAFLGGGATLFLLNYRTELVAVGVLLTLSSIYFTARTINKNCKACSVLPAKSRDAA